MVSRDATVSDVDHTQREDTDDPVDKLKCLIGARGRVIGVAGRFKKGKNLVAADHQ